MGDEGARGTSDRGPGEGLWLPDTLAGPLLGSGVASKTSPWAASHSLGGEVAKSWEMLAFRMTAQIRESARRRLDDCSPSENAHCDLGRVSDVRCGRELCQVRGRQGPLP